MGKSFDYRKKMNNNRKVHIKRVRKIVISSAVASTLVFQPFIPVIENGKLIGFTEESASAATLAEVGILENIAIDAELGNLEGPGPYDLNFSLTGTGLADIELVNPETVALFSAPSLAGNIVAAGPADVRVELLPVTLDDLPALGTLVTNLTGTLDTAVSGIVGTLDTLVGLLPAGVLEVNGLEELQNAVDALNNVDTALADLLVYEGQVAAVINNPDGTIRVDFTSGLDKHLDTAVDQVVMDLLNDVIVAAQALEVNLLQAVPIVDTVVNGLINGILSTATGTIVPAVQTAVDGIANGATNLTGELAAAQVIGSTQINLPTTINRVPAVSGEVPISGAIVNTNAIDVQLLNDLPVETSVVIPELDITAPIITPVADVTTIEDAPIASILVESNEEGAIAVGGLPTGLTFDDSTGLITGTPVVDDWGTTEERDFTVEVTATDEAGNEATPETFVITVQRDTDGDGDPDVSDPDDDNDGVPDGEETETDPKVDDIAPVISPIEDTTGIENIEIEDILVEVDEPNDYTVTVSGLPEGLAYDPETNSITGTPTVPDWGELETLDFDTTVTATDEAGNADTEEFVITIQRDTDGDGDPDVTDPDDDNDGILDGEETETDPKVDDIAPVISPIEDTTGIENIAIDDILVEVDEPNDYTVVVDGLPEGLSYDPETDSITGTPTVSDWEELEARNFDIIVTATDEAGNTDTEEFIITIQRDTDGDGDPDANDPDDDNDGATDEEEKDNSTDPKDETDVPDLEAPDMPIIDEVTSEDTEIVGEAEPGSEVIVTFPNGETETGTTDEDGNFVVVIPEDIDLTGGEQLEIIVRDEAGNDSEVMPIVVADTTPPIVLEIENQVVVEGTPIEDIEVVVENPGEQPQPELASTFIMRRISVRALPIEGVIVEGSPEGVMFDADSNTLSGIPVVDNWGETEESRGFQVTVRAWDEAGNEVTEIFMITVLRDTDRDTEPDTTDPDDDNDGIPDEEEIENGTDPKNPDTIAPVISPIEDVDAVENEPIDDIVVDVDEPSEVVVGGLPNGLEYDPETGIISGTPVINDWGETEETRDFETIVTATDEAGNESTETFVITIERDTDGDGDPDVTDPDDDNDGATDEEENDNGTNPKVDDIAPVISPIEDVGAVENEPIDDIVVDVDEPSEVVVDGLPNGLKYDPETGTISGTPVIDDWAASELEREYTVTISAEDEAGNTSTIEFTLVVQRDTDADGTPDGSDSDDDNDGATDEEEVQAGTNPWDNTNYPGSGSGSGSNTGKNQAMLPQTGESQNVFGVVSGLILAAASSAMLMFNKKKNASNSSKRNLKK